MSRDTRVTCARDMMRFAALWFECWSWFVVRVYIYLCSSLASTLEMYQSMGSSGNMILYIMLTHSSMFNADKFTQQWANYSIFGDRLIICTVCTVKLTSCVINLCLPRCIALYTCLINFRFFLDLLCSVFRSIISLQFYWMCCTALFKNTLRVLFHYSSLASNALATGAIRLV